MLFVQEGAVLCWRSLFGVVSENAALFFEKEGVFSLWGWRVGFVFFQAVMCEGIVFRETGGLGAPGRSSEVPHRH